MNPEQLNAAFEDVHAHLRRIENQPKGHFWIILMLFVVFLRGC